MRAAFYVEQGPSSVLKVGEQPKPEPGPGEVRVRLRTSGVNPSDWKARRGGAGRSGLIAPLIIPHSDGAGDIDTVGAGVPASRIGERVWIWNGQWKRPFGTAAEFIALPSAQAVPLPAGTDYAAGACLGIPAMTALQAVRLAELEPQSTVLVSGGAGAVGHYAIQFAKARGARVIATVSGDAKAAHARSAGADEIVNYRGEDVGARVKALTGGRGADAVIEVDFQANAKLLPAVLKPHGRVVVYGTSAAETSVAGLWLMLNSITVRLFLVYELLPPDRAAVLAELTERLTAGQLLHAVARRLPLSAIAEGHDIVERGEVIGNVVLEIP